MKIFNSSKSLYATSSDLNRYNNLSLDEKEYPTSVMEQTIRECKLAILNRPEALNAIDHTVAVPLFRLYRSWEADPSVGIVITKGNGPVFSVGGDVAQIYQWLMAGRLDECKNIFRVTYTLMHLISCFSKPNIALLNGLTVGGGSNISAMSRFRVATDKTVISNPETQIGMHPDAGASYYPSRLPGYLGEYLALTGDRLNGSESLACGLATHFIHAKKISLIEEKLSELETNDPSAIGRLLDHYSDTTRIHAKSILNRMEMINECFGFDTVEGIIAALESRANGADQVWCTSVLKKLKTASPLCLKVALKSIRLGRSQTIEECLRREYWMTVQAISGAVSRDFHEGVRSRLVEKTFAPKWDPPSLAQVTEERVNQYFLPLSPTEPPLELPIDRNQTSLPSTFSFKTCKEATVSESPARMSLKNPFNLVQARL